MMRTSTGPLGLITFSKLISIIYHSAELFFFFLLVRRHPSASPAPDQLLHGFQQMHVALVSPAALHLVVQLQDDLVLKLRVS